MAKNVVFEISDHFRVKNTPFHVEGTNIPFDVPNEVPLPTETVSIKGGKPRPIRFILECETIDKQEQIKAGYPADRVPTETERRLLTFFGGRLEAPGEFPNLVTFLKEAPWWEDYDGPRPPNSRIMYKEYKQDKVDDDFLVKEELVMKAKQLVLAIKRPEAVELLRLFNPGGIVSPQIELKQLKIRLLEIADTNPSFILDGAKSNHDKLVVLASKAVDYGILNIDIAGLLAMVDGEGQPQPITKMSDIGGRKAKLEKTVLFLESQDGKPYVEPLTLKVKAYEDSLELEDANTQQADKSKDKAAKSN